MRDGLAVLRQHFVVAPVVGVSIEDFSAFAFQVADDAKLIYPPAAHIGGDSGVEERDLGVGFVPAARVDGAAMHLMHQPGNGGIRRDSGQVGVADGDMGQDDALARGEGAGFKRGPRLGEHGIVLAGHENSLCGTRRKYGCGYPGHAHRRAAAQDGRGGRREMDITAALGEALQAHTHAQFQRNGYIRNKIFDF